MALRLPGYELTSPVNEGLVPGAKVNYDSGLSYEQAIDLFKGDEVWGIVREVGFVLTRVSPKPERRIFSNISNNPRNVNIFPHRDGESFALYADAPRPTEDTAVDHFGTSESILLDEVRKILDPTSDSPVKPTRDVPLRGSLVYLSEVLGMPVWHMRDNLNRCLSENFNPDHLFGLSGAINKRLIAASATYVHRWNEGDLMFISDGFNHRRVPRTDRYVKNTSNPLQRGALGRFAGL